MSQKHSRLILQIWGFLNTCMLCYKGWNSSHPFSDSFTLEPLCQLQIPIKQRLIHVWSIKTYLQTTRKKRSFNSIVLSILLSFSKIIVHDRTELFFPSSLQLLFLLRTLHLLLTMSDSTCVNPIISMSSHSLVSSKLRRFHETCSYEKGMLWK